MLVDYFRSDGAGEQSPGRLYPRLLPSLFPAEAPAHRSGISRELVGCPLNAGVTRSRHELIWCQKSLQQRTVRFRAKRRSLQLLFPDNLVSSEHSFVKRKKAVVQFVDLSFLLRFFVHAEKHRCPPGAAKQTFLYR